MAASPAGGGAGGGERGRTDEEEPPPPPPTSKSKKKKAGNAATPALKDCANCGASEGTVPGSPIHKPCSRCKITYYCSVRCQKQHWKWRHKRECRHREDFKPGDYACLDTKKVVDPVEYDDLAQHVGAGHGIWLIVGVLASYDDGRNVRVTMDGRDATSKVFGREVLCRLPPSSPAFDPQKLPLAPK